MLGFHCRRVKKHAHKTCEAFISYLLPARFGGLGSLWISFLCHAGVSCFCCTLHCGHTHHYHEPAQGNTNCEYSGKLCGSTAAFLNLGIISMCTPFIRRGARLHGSRAVLIVVCILGISVLLISLCMSCLCFLASPRTFAHTFMAFCKSTCSLCSCPFLQQRTCG